MNVLKISYLIGVHNEGSAYLKPLFDKLLTSIDDNDEVVVVDDCSDEETTIKCLAEYSDKVKVITHKFEGDFSEHKNFMIEQCSGHYIFNIDGDEMPAPSLIKTLKELLINNEEVDLFYVPRINIVNGLTSEDIQKWGWQVNENQWINYPDYQGRIFKNSPNIRWEGKVHEKIVGNSTHAPLPAYDEFNVPVVSYCLLHVKDIDRQRKQNLLYQNL